MNIKRLRELCEKATPEPWIYAPSYLAIFHETISRHKVLFSFLYHKDCGAKGTMEDAEFIAAARTALPEALEEIEKLQHEITELKAEIEWYELNKTQFENLSDKLIKENDELKAIVKELLTPAMLGAAEYDIDINDCLKRVEKMLGVKKDE